MRVAANATHGREARATAAKREKAAGENPAVENQQVPIWEPANARRPVFNGYHMGTKVPLQLPLWGGVSPLQPARSAAFSPPPPLPPGNRPIPPRHGDSRAASGGCAAAPRPYAANAARSPTLPNVRLRPVRRRVLMHGYVPSVPWFPGSGFAAGFRELTRKRLVRPRLHAEASRPPHFSGEGLSPVGRRHRKRAQFGLSPFSLSFHAALSLSLRAATSAGDIVTTG